MAALARRALHAGAFVAIPAIVALVTVEVVLRYGFARPLGWAGEVAGLLLLAVFASAMPDGAVAGRNIRVDLLYVRLGGRARRAADALAALAGAAVSALVAYKAAANVPEMIRFQEAGMLSAVPFWPLSALLAASAALLLAHFALRLAAALAGRDGA